MMPVYVKGKKVLIVGLGKTGLALARLLAEEGALVTVNDIKEVSGLPAGVRAEFGTHRIKTFINQDLILVSPGVSIRQEAFRQARKLGIPISNDLELAFSLTCAPFLAVAGTNGKTTTTTLLGNIFKQAGRKIVVGGNIGEPLSPLMRQQPEFVIAEVSSFQLETIQGFRPHVGIMLNISPDHLDRYPSWPEYIKAKSRLFINQTAEDFALIKTGVPAQLLSERSGKRIFFQTDTLRPEGAMVMGQDLIVRLDGREEQICSLNQVKLAGKHNQENILAAALTAWLCGIDRAVIQKSLSEFTGLSHRIELVAEIKGIRFIDDSKGTNVGAVIAAVKSLEGPIWLILGGQDKGNDYQPLIPLVKDRVKGILAIGASRKKINHFFRDLVPVYCSDSFKDAVNLGFSMASPGDAVVLSPACASFDMFKSYAHRGQVFKQLVQEIGYAQKSGL